MCDEYASPVAQQVSGLQGRQAGGSAPASTPEARLAGLMRRDLNTTVSARELRMFIRANWRAVCAYAHAIHDEGDTGATDKGNE
jgi:hypothetical protein